MDKHRERDSLSPSIKNKSLLSDALSVEEASIFSKYIVSNVLDLPNLDDESRGMTKEARNILIEISQEFELSVRDSLLCCSASSLNRKSTENQSMSKRSDLLLSRKEVLKRLGISNATLYNWLNPNSSYYRQEFPKQVQLGIRRVGWRESEIDEFINSLT